MGGEGETCVAGSGQGKAGSPGCDGDRGGVQLRTSYGIWVTVYGIYGIYGDLLRVVLITMLNLSFANHLVYPRPLYYATFQQLPSCMCFAASRRSLAYVIDHVQCLHAACRTRASSHVNVRRIFKIEDVIHKLARLWSTNWWIVHSLRQKVHSFRPIYILELHSRGSTSNFQVVHDELFFFSSIEGEHLLAHLISDFY